VQIRRDAGEGSTVNVRGLPQVVTLMNGESFLGAGSITSVQPSFTDIPSSLFSGASVIKSSTASLLSAGISGTIDLKTRRPFDLKPGLHGAFAMEGATGSSSKKFDPHFNGLVSWHNDTVGLLISGSYSKDHLGNSYSGIQRTMAAAWPMNRSPMPRAMAVSASTTPPAAPPSRAAST
jgi:TonB-dependent receptor